MNWRALNIIIWYFDLRCEQLIFLRIRTNWWYPRTPKSASKMHKTSIINPFSQAQSTRLCPSVTSFTKWSLTILYPPIALIVHISLYSAQSLARAMQPASLSATQSSTLGARVVPFLRRKLLLREDPWLFHPR